MKVNKFRELFSNERFQGIDRFIISLRKLAVENNQKLHKTDIILYLNKEKKHFGFISSAKKKKKNEKTINNNPNCFENGREC